MGSAAVLYERRITRGRELLAEDDAKFGEISAEVKFQIAAE